MKKRRKKLYDGEIFTGKEIKNRDVDWGVKMDCGCETTVWKNSYHRAEDYQEKYCKGHDSLKAPVSW